MKPMLASRYVGWMAVRPLKIGDEEFAPGDRVPQKHLEAMRDPEVLIRTNRLAAVAKDMNKVPRMLRKDVVEEEEMRQRILGPRIASQIGEIIPTALLGEDEPEVEEEGQPDPTEQVEGPAETGLDPLNPAVEPGEPESPTGETRTESEIVADEQAALAREELAAQEPADPAVLAQGEPEATPETEQPPAEPVPVVPEAGAEETAQEVPGAEPTEEGGQ